MSNTVNIGRNALFLYLRMLLTMGVSLYTSRVILQVLGIEDYGVYSIVGGVVSMFGFFNAAMTSATQRFLAFDIGSGNEIRLRNTFNTTFIIHCFIVLLTFILAETVGLWYIQNKLNVPPNRINTVFRVYHFSVLTFLVGLIQVPFSALILARERMSIFAIISIVESLLKLLIVYILLMFDMDKLKLYAILMFTLSLLIMLFYGVYCNLYFKESNFKWYYDKKYFRTLIAYSGWNLFGNVAALAKGQGINLILNLFYGVTVNAAYGVMVQVQTAVYTFVTNFQMAVNPQIIKSYAAGDKQQYLKLILQSSRFSFFFMLIITVPIIYNIDFILIKWLGKPPQYSASFIKICLITVLIDCISGPLMTGVQATGNIKWYQIVVGSVLFLNLPLSYFLLLFTNNPVSIFVLSVFLSLVSLYLRLIFLKVSINLSISLFFKVVIFRISIVSLAIFLFILLILPGSKQVNSSLVEFLFESFYAFTVVCLSILVVGMSQSERIFYLIN